MSSHFFGFAVKPSPTYLQTRLTALLASFTSDATSITETLFVPLSSETELQSPFPLFTCASAMEKHIKTLHRQLKPYGYSLSVCQDLFARFYNFKSWQEFHASVHKILSTSDTEAAHSYWLQVSLDDVNPYTTGLESHVLRFASKERFKQFCATVALPHDTAWALVDVETGEKVIASRMLSRVIAAGESIPGSPHWMRSAYRKLEQTCPPLTLPFHDTGMANLYLVKCKMSPRDNDIPSVFPGVVCDIFRNKEARPLVSFRLDDYATSAGSIQKAKFLKHFRYYDTMFLNCMASVEGRKSEADSLIGIIASHYLDQIKDVKRLYAARTAFQEGRECSDQWWRLLVDVWHSLADVSHSALGSYLREPTAQGLADIKETLGHQDQHFGSCTGKRVITTTGYGSTYQHQRMRRKKHTQDRIESLLAGKTNSCDCSFLMAELERRLAEASLSAKKWKMTGKYELRKVTSVTADALTPVNAFDTGVRSDNPQILAKAAALADMDLWMVTDQENAYSVSQGEVRPSLAAPAVYALIDDLHEGKHARENSKGANPTWGGLSFLFDEKALAAHVLCRGDYSALPLHGNEQWHIGLWHLVPETWLETIAQTERCSLHILDHDCKTLPREVFRKFEALGVIDPLKVVHDGNGGLLSGESDALDTIWVKRFPAGVPTPYFFEMLGYVTAFRLAGRNYADLNEMAREMVTNFDKLHVDDIITVSSLLYGAYEAAGIDYGARSHKTNFYGECGNYIMSLGEYALKNSVAPVFADFALYFQEIRDELKSKAEKSNCSAALMAVRGKFIGEFLARLLNEERYTFMSEQAREMSRGTWYNG